MLVFISWSKRSSRQVAEALRAFIADVIYTAKPWVSTQDMASGVAWFQELGERLHEARIGVICVTPENQSEPWLLFEAGALAKNITASGTNDDLDVQRSYACPYVFGMGLGELTGPLQNLQAREADRDGTRALMETINLVLGDDGLPTERLARNFDGWWDSSFR